MSENSVLLGIKYEAARIGDVGNDALAGIEEQMREEVGVGWESDDRVIRGRNAVRREHGLPGLGSQATGLLRPKTPNVRCGAGSLGGSSTVATGGPTPARSSVRWQ